MKSETAAATEKVREVMYAIYMSRYQAEENESSMEELGPEESEKLVVDCVMSGSYELSKPRYCDQCKKDVDVKWELAVCDKNKEGITELQKEHGNVTDDGVTTCDDIYCNPQIEPVQMFDVTKEFLKTHNVSLKCEVCDQYLDESELGDSTENGDGSNSQTPPDSKRCSNCGGRGYITQVVPDYHRIECICCNGTGLSENTREGGGDTT